MRQVRVVRGQSGRRRLWVHAGRRRRPRVGQRFRQVLGPGRGRRRGLSARGERQGGGSPRPGGSLCPWGKVGGRPGLGRTGGPVVTRGEGLDRGQGLEGRGVTRGAGGRRRDVPAALLAPLLAAL